MNVTAARMRPEARRSPIQLPWPWIWAIVVTALLAWGARAHLERYITPQRGIGYWLGIVGGSSMLLLLLYSARKRANWLRWMGSIPAWFEIHMTLGVLGPVLVLFHSNFHLGATNSNVALFSMLLVAGSGVVGRYIYTRLHARLDGHEDTFEQLKAAGERLATQANSVAFLPGLLESIELVEERWIEPPHNPIARPLHLLTGAARLRIARWKVRSEVREALGRALAAGSPLVATHAPRIATAALRYAYRRLEARRRMVEYRRYALLFSFWHVLHIPLFFMLLIAGIVHVVAVNVY
jgi:hypothetical protein